MAKLHFMCGKMAAGKSHHAKALARAEGAILFVQDDLLDAFYPGQIRTIDEFAQCSDRLRNGLSNLIVDLLKRDISVVLDFPGNTRTQRAWFRGLFERAGAAHELHYIDASDDMCKHQLKRRSSALPAGTPWTTDAEFDAITAYFQAPAEDERFNVIHHPR